MKNICCFILFLASVVLVSAQSKAIYVNPDFNKLARHHRILAILPFDVNMDLRPKEREQITKEQLYEMEISEGEGVQGALHSYFLKKRGHGDFKVNFQDPRKTNAELSKAGIDLTMVRQHTPAELASLLDVDGVVWGDLRTTKPMSEGTSATLGVLFGVWGPTNSGSISIQRISLRSRPQFLRNRQEREQEIEQEEKSLHGRNPLMRASSLRENPDFVSVSNYAYNPRSGE